MSYWHNVSLLAQKYPNKLEVHCSLHIMEHNTQTDFETFFKKYFYLKNNSIHMYIMTVLDDKSTYIKTCYYKLFTQIECY